MPITNTIALVIMGVTLLVIFFVAGYVFCMRDKKKTNDFGTAGSLIVYTDDPDGPYIFFESGIPIDELLKHDTVKLSVREFTSQK